ncbi:MULTISPECIES: GAP family protein [unclassified Streptomyces]|uniref:GAP family protein n=1 Tax=unclassified Streptomyces TaxID=2593676 RepID=UPI002E17EFC9|nr:MULTISPECIES: GAP family protein [unclassified Streptomyces]
MGAVLGDVLGFAAAVAISPLPIIAIILILATPRGRLNGPLFTVGWILGLSALGAVMLAIASPAGASAHNQPATWVGAVKLALGVLLVLFGARQWHRHPKDLSQAQLPKWMGAIDRLTPVKVFGLALAALNAKNAPLTIAAAASIGSAGRRRSISRLDLRSSMNSAWRGSLRGRLDLSAMAASSRVLRECCCRRSARRPGCGYRGLVVRCPR